MLEVLTKWILELVRILVDFLCPCGLLFISKYPAGEIFCFYDKYSVTRYKDVVYLVSCRRELAG